MKMADQMRIIQAPEISLQLRQGIKSLRSVTSLSMQAKHRARLCKTLQIIFCLWQALDVCLWRDSRTEKDIIHLMIKYVHDVKKELRQFSRSLRGIGVVHFAFR